MIQENAQIKPKELLFKMCASCRSEVRFGIIVRTLLNPQLLHGRTIVLADCALEC